MEIEELIQSIDIVEYISQYVELTQKGDEWWGLSCFKSENTPSFSVRKDPPFFYDYSSGIGGNLYRFIMEIKHCTPAEAVEEMVRFSGVDTESVKPREKMAATIDCKRYMRKKSTEKPSKATILPDNFMERYSVNPEKLSVWEAEGISKEALEKFQVRYDEFSDRLVYPIRNLSGQIVNIGGRTLDQEWKRKELRKYCYFYSWGTMDTIYGLAENTESILEKKEIILFEGCKSVLIASSWGIHNAGALLTSHLIRKAEGGIRSMSYKSCFSEKAAVGTDVFRPVFWFRDSDKEEYCAYYGVAHSKCYTDYGLVRTGCVGCPFGKRIGDEMSVLSQYEPRLYKAALAVFGKSYDYTQKYMDYRNKRKAEYKNIKEKL